MHFRAAETYRRDQCAYITDTRAHPFEQNRCARRESHLYSRWIPRATYYEGIALIQSRRRVPPDRSSAAAMIIHAARRVAASVHTIEQTCRLSRLRAFET